MSSIGCGRFTETQWSEYVFSDQKAVALEQHQQECRACQTELLELHHTAHLLRQVPLSEPTIHDTFIDSVLREHAADQARTTKHPSQCPFLRRPIPMFGGVLGATAVLFITLSLWATNGDLQHDLGHVGAPIRTASVSRLVESESHELNGMLVANGMTYAQPPSEALATEAPTATPLRAPSGSTHSATTASF